MYNFRKWLNAVLCVGAAFILAGCGPSAGEIEKKLKTETFPKLFKNEKSFYYNAEVVNVSVKDEGKGNFSGTIEFRRNGKICKRPDCGKKYLYVSGLDSKVSADCPIAYCLGHKERIPILYSGGHCTWHPTRIEKIEQEIKRYAPNAEIPPRN